MSPERFRILIGSLAILMAIVAARSWKKTGPRLPIWLEIAAAVGLAILFVASIVSSG